MADQDFNIKVITTADTSGLRQTKAEIDALNIAAESGGKKYLPVQGFTGAGFLEEAKKDTSDLADEAGRSAINLGRARQEAIVLSRELATGGNVTRTLGSLLGSLGIPITIAALAAIGVWKAFESSAEAVKKTREEQEKLNEELDKHLKSAEHISNVEEWDKANESIEEQIRLLERRLYLSTDTKERASIFLQLQYAEQEKRLLPEIVAKGLERAAVERLVADEIKAQVDAVNEVARGYDRARALSDQNAKAASELRKIQRESQSDALKEKVDTGKLTEVDALTEKEKERAKAASEDHDSAIDQVNQRMKANADEFAQFDAQSKAAHKTLQDQRVELDKIQYLKGLPPSALEPDEAEKVKNIQAYRDALREQEKITEAIDENRRKSALASDSELPKLLREKEILDQIYQAEEARNKAIFEREKKAATLDEIKKSSSQTQAVLRNELAAKQAREAGDERSAELYEKTAAQFEASMTPQQRAELEKIRAENAPKPVGRTAGVGESQELVDQTELNRVNFERGQRGEKPLQKASKDEAILSAIEDQTIWMKTVWGP